VCAGEGREKHLARFSATTKAVPFLKLLNPDVYSRHYILVLTVPLPEKALIAEIRRMAASSRRGARGFAGNAITKNLVTGIGDDCAVLGFAPGREILVTTDFSLQGIHFRRDWHPAESVGHRCLARGLSDIAAMGGEPVAAFLSLALPRDLPQAWVGRFVRGLIGLADRYGVALAGGDTAESPAGILADIIVVGSVPKGRAVLRSGARAGDRIFVSGELGGSAAAFVEMRASDSRSSTRASARIRATGDPSLRRVLRFAQDFGARLKRRANASSSVRDDAKRVDTLHGLNVRPADYPRHFYPEPRIEVGRVLREKGLATAMIDLSDGLSTDLAHICEESGVGAELGSALIPCARVGKPAREVELGLALHGGEDYELLFTAPAGKRVPAQIGGVALTQIGVITHSRGIFVHNEKGVGFALEARGWEHFSRS
jgi:thiamine-monophosphate kinase